MKNFITGIIIGVLFGVAGTIYTMRKNAGADINTSAPSDEMKKNDSKVTTSEIIGDDKKEPLDNIELSGNFLRSFCNISKESCGRIPTPETWENASMEDCRSRNLHMIRLLPEAIEYYVNSNKYLYENLHISRDEYIETLIKSVVIALDKDENIHNHIINHTPISDMDLIDLHAIVHAAYQGGLDSGVDFAAHYLLSTSVDQYEKAPVKEDIDEGN